MKFVRVVVLFLIFAFGTLAVKAQSSSELKRRRAELTAELENLNREYQETLKNKKSTLKQLNLLKEQISLREEKISTVNSEIRGLDNQITENSHTVRTLQGQLNQLKKEYAAMIVFAYHNQSAYNKLMFVFASKDFNQAYKRLKYLHQFGTYRERQAASIQGTQQDLHVKINQLDRTKKEKSSLLQEQEKEKETLGKQKSEQDQVAQSLSQQAGTLRKQQREVRNRIALANRQIASAIRREIEEARRKAEAEARAAAARAAAQAAAQARAENKSASEVAAAAKPKAIARSSDSQVLSATPEAAKLSNDFLGNKGRLPWPVSNGFVTLDFGIYMQEGIKNDNRGIDIRTSGGAAVRAVFEGTVASVNDVSGSYLVVIRHGEYFTGYFNLRSVSVSAGQKVSTRQTIGTVATDPTTGEPSVHFELYRGKNVINPKSWLAAQ
ncbi:peptidoglycan DD-metalloendopeptidase family protein [Mucilaginibacter sp. Bleaf8]|uniref:murein hydrolase activator EnvC family protein n=1 Tax=Mucilaginibacter sp. Bleaf8 TaxID=2834430 RepID=UPI001BCDBB14|nr:peptidoglycan DD-metalloendopeptidase family protein [Mucilaginibacter sp. Bleaf8]MBS7566057.1 peptidoglycan DD-metalloendopeptidase family protein [Mucilaginibacter sp. Bleaf8]